MNKKPVGRCLKCQFWQPLASQKPPACWPPAPRDEGECHLRAPLVGRHGRSWPVTRGDDFCGDFAELEDMSRSGVVETSFQE
ncbi:hypothetical protein Spb1_20330 [Planctopirus ephydatiae]|uniref:Uncharacterized protein n=1 Tax=Planctopirus ephydatiae TaxID=2528019 RepID=A0A518GN90_9PLAN|nr:hypothetical protein Spb1_20330 [Planctopirus ephydatiae]